MNLAVPPLHTAQTPPVPRPPVRNARADRVVEMTNHAWQSYMTYAAGHDELMPTAKSFRDKWAHSAMTAVDSLDTLLLMGLTEAFEEATNLALKAKPQEGQYVSVFEFTIRQIGGLLSVHAATNERAFLDKALWWARALSPAYSQASGIPYHGVTLGSTHKSNEGWCNHKTPLAEVGSMQLELLYLAEAANVTHFATTAERILQYFKDVVRNGWPNNSTYYDEDAPIMVHKGLWPAFVDPVTGRFSGSAGMASLSDSFYEYLLKQWIMTGKGDVELLDMYEDSVEAMLNHLLRYAKGRNTPFLGQQGIGFDPSTDHLSCFVPGMLVLGVMHGAHSNHSSRTRSWGEEDVVHAAIDLAAGCYQMYVDTNTGIGPEAARFQLDGTRVTTKSKYILRPELIESLFYLYRFTHDERYREWGWAITQAINNTCRMESGFAGLVDVEKDGGEKDPMESFFIAETLKYLYLLFADEESIALDQYVFNTEAHPLPVLRHSKG